MSNDLSYDEQRAIQQQIHEKKTGILESTRRMLGLIDESEAIGNNTAVQLVEQREKLEEIERKCDSIDNTLKNTKQNINKLGSIFGGLKNYFNPPKSNFTKSMSQPQISESQKKKSKDEKSSSSNRATDLNNDTDTYCGKARHQMDDIERETDEGLHDIHLGVNRLKSLALQMNEELTRQDPLIARVGNKVDGLNRGVKVQNEAMKQILR